MPVFRNSRIQKKIMLVILSVSAFSILLTCAGFVVYEIATYRMRLVTDLKAKAEILGANCTGSIVFNNSRDAADILKALSSQPRILSGVIFTQDKKVFAGYYAETNSGAGESSLPSDGYEFATNRLTLATPIMLNNERVGTIVLQSNLEGLQSRLGSYGVIVAVLLIVSFSAAALIASRVQRRISKPITDLAELAQRVSENKNYSLRAVKTSDDELGTLAVAFNEMLSKIQERESSLTSAYETLAKEIKEREQSVEAKRLAEVRFKTTLDHLMEGCQIIDFEWKYRYLNDVAVLHARKERGELVGRTMMEMYPGIEATLMFSRLNQCMNERIPQVMDNEFAYPDGERRWFHLNIEPVPEGIFILTIDVTQEKHLQKKLKEYHEQLEETVKQRTSELEAANKELEAFSYSVSHDLRAPLRHVDGFSEMLLKHASGILDEKGKRYLHTISGSAKQMGQLIDDLLVFSRMGRIEMCTTKVNLTLVARDMIASLNHDTSGRAIEWRVDELPEVEADPSMIRLVYQNLIGNAIKFTGTRQQALIEIGAAHTDDEYIMFVRDNGVGFEQQYSNKLFGVFQRLHRSEEFEGTGVGLANVRRIILRHNGRTWAEAESNVGATFYFSLPKKKDKA